VARPERQTGVLDDSPELIDQHHRLDQFDVAKLGVPVHVSGGHQQCLMYLKDRSFGLVLNSDVKHNLQMIMSIINY
jgi:hypothetical protein